MEYGKSKALFQEANKYIPGGVNSPVRAFRSVGMDPIYIARGDGSHVFDEDGNEYVDYITSWGPLILGHNNEPVREAIIEAASLGTSYGACNRLEPEMARTICEFFPSVEKVRMVNSGTEATMSAVRLARGYTGRNKIIKFEGCYHGHADSFLVKAGSGLATFGQTSSPGVTAGVADDTLIASFNDIASVERLVEKFRDEIAALIVEPIMGNMGVILPEEGFLKALRDLTAEHGIVLIFDEVISGFRTTRGGAQEFYGISPDMTCLGKIIGGGLPVGAFGGRADIMDQLSPIGPVYQAGTLSGNPLALAAGLAMLRQLAAPGFYDNLEEIGKDFERRMLETIAPWADRLSYNRAGSLSTLFFRAGGVRSYADAAESNTGQYTTFFKEMIREGIYLPPSQFEAIFLSAAHTMSDFEKTFEAIRRALSKVFA